MPRRAGEFTAKTKNELAERAGHRCSHPTCSAMTSGPGASGGSRKNGEAAHIVPVSPQGPRGQFARETSARIDDVSNGIWLCANHATLIDQQDGVDYPPFVLQAWKKRHETCVAVDQGSPVTRYGWIHELNVRSSPLLPTGKLAFGPATIIYGPNSSGKTQLLRLVTSSRAADFRGWSARGGIDCDIRWFDPHLRSLRLVIPDQGRPEFYMGDETFPVRPSPPTVIALHQILDSRSIAEVLGMLGLSASDLPALVPLLGRRGGNGFDGSHVDRAELDADGELVAYVEEDWPTGKYLPFRVLSSGEQAALLVELAIVRARSLQTSGVAALVIDPWPTVTGGLGRALGTLLAQLTHDIQVFVTTEQRDVNFDTTGWAKIHLPAAQPQTELRTVRITV